MDSQFRDAVDAPPWPTLLCIDDDPQIIESIRLRLGEFEVHVLSGTHGTHGFWLAANECPDLVITDMRMPQGQGDYIVECLRSNAKTQHIPIVVLTGQRTPDAICRIRQLDVQAVLIKPVLFDQLLSVIRQHIPLRPQKSEAAMD